MFLKFLSLYNMLEILKYDIYNTIYIKKIIYL